jgi:hypothetical protein
MSRRSLGEAIAHTVMPCYLESVAESGDVVTKDKCANFAKLASAERGKKSFRIRLRRRAAHTVVIARHPFA